METETKLAIKNVNLRINQIEQLLKPPVCTCSGKDQPTHGKIVRLADPFKERNRSLLEQNRVLKNSVMDLESKVHELEEDNKSLQNQVNRYHKDLKSGALRYLGQKFEAVNPLDIVGSLKAHNKELIDRNANLACANDELIDENKDLKDKVGWYIWKVGTNVILPEDNAENKEAKESEEFIALQKENEELKERYESSRKVSFEDITTTIAEYMEKWNAEHKPQDHGGYNKSSRFMSDFIVLEIENRRLSEENAELNKIADEHWQRWADRVKCVCENKKAKEDEAPKTVRFRRYSPFKAVSDKEQIEILTDTIAKQEKLISLLSEKIESAKKEVG